MVVLIVSFSIVLDFNRSHRLLFICSAVFTYSSVFCNVVWCIYAVRSMEFPSFEIKTEADGYDIAEYSHDDKPNSGKLVFGFWSVIKLTCCSDHETEV